MGLDKNNQESENIVENDLTEIVIEKISVKKDISRKTSLSKSTTGNNFDEIWRRLVPYLF